MSFLSKLFGGSRASEPPAPAAPDAEVEHKGFTIRAIPRREGGQFQVAGTVEKLVGDTVRSHSFVRADKSPNKDEIVEMSLSKGRLMVDQQGDALFG